MELSKDGGGDLAEGSADLGLSELEESRHRSTRLLRTPTSPKGIGRSSLATLRASRTAWGRSAEMTVAGKRAGNAPDPRKCATQVSVFAFPTAQTKNAVETAVAAAAA